MCAKLRQRSGLHPVTGDTSDRRLLASSLKNCFQIGLFPGKSAVFQSSPPFAAGFPAFLFQSCLYPRPAVPDSACALSARLPGLHSAPPAPAPAPGCAVRQNPPMFPGNASISLCRRFSSPPQAAGSAPPGLPAPPAAAARPCSRVSLTLLSS